MEEILKQPAQDVINLLVGRHRTNGLNYSDYVNEVGNKYNIQDGHRAIKEYLLNMGIIQMDRPVGNEENGRVMHYKLGLENYQGTAFIDSINKAEVDAKRISQEQQQEKEYEKLYKQLQQEVLLLQKDKLEYDTTIRAKEAIIRGQTIELNKLNLIKLYYSLGGLVVGTLIGILIKMFGQ